MKPCCSFFFALYIISSIFTSSCSYENTELSLGSGFDSTWTFSNSNDYEFDENLVEVVGGKAQLKVLDLEHTGEDFNSGSHVGSYGHNGIFLLDKGSDRNILTLMSELIPNILGYWKFESSFEDSSANRLHGNPVGSISFDTDAQLATNSIALNGTTDRIDVPHSTMISGLDEFSISSWVNFSNITTGGGSSDYQTILTKGSRIWGANSEIEWAIGHIPSSNIINFQVFDSVGATFSRADISNINTRLNSNQWYHLLAT